MPLSFASLFIYNLLSGSVDDRRTSFLWSHRRTKIPFSLSPRPGNFVISIFVPALSPFSFLFFFSFYRTWFEFSTSYITSLPNKLRRPFNKQIKGKGEKKKASPKIRNFISSPANVWLGRKGERQNKRTNEDRGRGRSHRRTILRIDIWDSDFQLSVQRGIRVSLVFIRTWPRMIMRCYRFRRTMLRQKCETSYQ